MVVSVTAGRLLRRGTDGLRADQIKDLLDNAGKVDGILDEINARRDVFLDTEAKAMARIGEAEKAEAGLVEREGALTDAQAALDVEKADAANKRQAGMDALARRNREVMTSEAASDERKTALNARAQEIEDKGHAQEEELRGRLEAVEAQEAAAEERDQAQNKRESGLNDRQRSIETAASMVKQAVAPLG